MINKMKEKATVAGYKAFLVLTGLVTGAVALMPRMVRADAQSLMEMAI